MSPPTTLFPVPERYVSIARETTAATIPASIGTTMPMETFKPSDKPEWLRNTAWYGDMGNVHGIVQGPMIGGFDAGGPYFGDMIGHILYNLLGDYTAQGTAASPSAVTNAITAAGSTTLSVASGGASFTAGMNLWLEDASTPALNEIVTVASSTATTITLVTGTRFAHATALPFTNTTAPYTHVFTMLNSNTNPGTGNGAGQPPTHTFTDRTGIPATGLAAQYAYSTFTEMTLDGSAEKFITWEGKALSLVRQIAGSPPAAANPSALQPLPAWRSTVKLTPVGGGALALVNDIGEWSFSIARENMKPMWTASGSQAPYVIPRGTLGLTGKLMFTPAIDETPLLALLANTQPQIQMFVSNGLSGVNLTSLQVDVGLGAYQTSDLDGDVLFGWEVPFEGVHSSATFNGVTMSGASGGAGAVKVTLQNAIPTY